MWYTSMKTSAVTQELMPCQSGDLKGVKRTEKSSDAEMKKWTSSIQLGSNKVAYDTNKQSDSSSVTPVNHFLEIFMFT